MAAVTVPEHFQLSPVARLLEAPRFEVIPVGGMRNECPCLPGTTVTVTCSQRHGVDRTLDVSERLARRGYRVVPHLAARLVRDRDHLERIVARLEAAGIGEAFVVGGDASPPAGSYRDAGDLLEALDSLCNTSLEWSASQATRRGIRSSPRRGCSRPCGAISRTPTTW